MSAVGLLLLEDPKARARAEAKLRNGTARKRGAFFGKDKSGQPPAAGAARRQPNLPPTIPDEEDENDSPIVRPSTSLSQSIALPHRKKADSTSDRSSSRSSTIFGRKNSVSEASSIKSGSSGRVSQLSAAVSTAVSSNYSRDQPTYKEDYIVPTRNPAGLPPFQYKRPVYRTKPTIPEPDANKERDLQARYWASSRNAKPQVQLNGVQQEDWASAKLESESEPEWPPSPALPSVDPNPPRLPAAARMSLFGDTIFNEYKDAPPVSEAGSRAAERSRKSTRDGRFYSTMVARNSLMFPEEPILQTPGAASRSNPMDSYAVPKVADLPNSGQVSPRAVEPQQVKRKQTRGNAYALTPRMVHPPPPPPPQSKLPSLPVPQQKPTSKSSAASLDSTSQHSGSSSRLDLPVERTIAADAVSISRSSGSTRKSPALTFSSNVRESTVFDDCAWEEDIDFAYAEEAEANCDYDWDDRSRTNSFQNEGVDPHYRPARDTRSSSVYSGEGHGGARDSFYENGVLGGSTPNAERPGTERRDSQMSSDPVRGSFVGHRGFAAARNSNGDKLAKASKLPPLDVSQSSLKAQGLSNSSDSDDETETSPGTPDDMEFPMPPGSADALKFPLPPGSPNPLDVPVPPVSNRISDSNSSDRDSWNSHSKHRKSSSYGSYESLKRASTAPSTAPSSVPSARDTGRWSLASASSIPSIPSVIPGKHKRTSSTPKATMSPPLETQLTQGPEEEKLTQMVNNRFSPHTLQVNPERDSLVMRRPRTSGDRRLLQGAGRAVQRYRPTTPNSNRRGPQGYEAFNGPMDTSSVPAWI